ncbi:hypothetical protein SAY87_006794 [Trapa incisa]|uniref:Uncharacterized protein n=1 Tax=Trapa incisa TaxID=236973 RepID=A0AAN7K1P6_9MYRT|nr:hypothetical protein SAY87_006794 [Trapa incisa]
MKGQPGQRQKQGKRQLLGVFQSGQMVRQSICSLSLSSSISSIPVGPQRQLGVIPTKNQMLLGRKLMGILLPWHMEGETKGIILNKFSHQLGWEEA